MCLLSLLRTTRSINLPMNVRLDIGLIELIENYRPVSTLPIFGKIFEKIIYSHLYKYLIQKGMISDSQFGFRDNHSTGHAIHHSVNIIKKGLQSKNHILGMFIDLSKAFDTLDHELILRKLENCGIRGISNDLLRSYISNRKKFTYVLGENLPLSLYYLEFHKDMYLDHYFFFCILMT